MGKINRNDPCPCGSGKKYKKCCLSLERKIGPLDNVDDLLDYAATWIFSKEWLKNEFETIKQNYSSVTDHQLNDKLWLCLRNAFMFDHKLSDHHDMSPFYHFFHHASLPLRYKEVYQGLIFNALSFYRVVDIDYQCQVMAVEDIITEDIIQLYLKGEEIDCFLGDVILSRVAPYRKGFVSLTPLIESIYLIHAMPLKEYFYRYPADRRKGFISGFDVLDFFYNDKNYPKSLDEVKKALKNKLKHIELSIDFRTLPNRIDTHHSVKEAFPEIINFDFLTNRDHEETRELLEQLWGSYPRKDLDGATLDEVHPVGLKEQSLMNLFNILVKENINSKDYSSLEDANKALHEFREGWIDAPLNMMKEKTPRQIILDERKSLNNQSKEIELNIELEREIDYDRNLADKLYNEGLHLFNQGTLVGAADCFGQVTKMYPDIYRAWGNLGASYAYLGDKKLAGQCFRKALSLQPDYEFAKQCLDFIKDKSVKQLSLYGISGALLRVMHDAGKNKKKDDKELNVWDELDKKFKELGDQKNR